jgi:hypothetical protein
VSFRTLAVITSIVTSVLGLGYLFVGSLVIDRWHIEPTESVLLFGRRIGALYIGLSVIFFLARSVPVSIARTALSAGTAVALSLLVLSGVYELSTGHVGSGILVSIAIEFLLALGYIRIFFAERRAAAERSPHNS